MFGIALRASAYRNGDVWGGTLHGRGNSAAAVTLG